MRRRKSQAPCRHTGAVLRYASDDDDDSSSSNSAARTHVSETSDDEGGTADAAFVTPDATPPASGPSSPLAPPPRAWTGQEEEDCTHPAGYADVMYLVDPYTRRISTLTWPLLACPGRREKVQHLLGSMELNIRNVHMMASMDSRNSDNGSPPLEVYAARRQFEWRDSASDTTHTAIISYLQQKHPPRNTGGERCVLPPNAGIKWFSLPLATDPGAADDTPHLHVAGRALLYVNTPACAALLPHVRWRNSYAMFQPLQVSDAEWRAHVERVMFEREPAVQGLRRRFADAALVKHMAERAIDDVNAMRCFVDADTSPQARCALAQLVNNHRLACDAYTVTEREINAKLPLTCMMCYEPTRMRCSVCHMAVFCSTRCATLAWRVMGHRGSCRLPERYENASTHPPPPPGEQ